MIKAFLASCDDSGECKIFDTRKGTLYRTLRKRHKNICSSAAFLTTRADDIVTGGLDSQMIVWNHATVQFIQDINTQEILQKLGDNSVNMFNPPMVNVLSLSQDGRLLASGLGNGSLQLFHVLKGKRALAPSLLINQHGSTGITSLDFIKTSDSYILASGGNDMEINLWRLPPIATNAKGKQLVPENEMALEQDEIIKYQIYQTKLQTKINTLESMKLNSRDFLLVGDQTPVLKMIDVTDLLEI